MKVRPSAPVIAAGAVVLSLAVAAVYGGWAASSAPSATGPLAAGSGAGLCWQPPPGQVLTAGLYIGQNNTSSPLTLIGAMLTGVRGIRKYAVYADLIQPGQGAVGDLHGYPRAPLRHRLAGMVVPPHATVQVLFTVTAASRLALATDENVYYTYAGQVYLTSGNWFLGIPPGEHS